jgi:hypothetical protein
MLNLENIKFMIDIAHLQGFQWFTLERGNKILNHIPVVSSTVFDHL